MENLKSKKVALVVAHPDDETLWAGGTIMAHTEWDCFVACLCRQSDPDRAPKFYKVLESLGATGAMANLDDGPEQKPLNEKELDAAILKLLPEHQVDLLLSHDPGGEYTRHLRHEEIGAAVIRLWEKQLLVASELWTFAYEDGKRSYLPKAVQGADVYFKLPVVLWEKKYHLMNELYGFHADGWEAQTTPETEAFRRFLNPQQAMEWLYQRKVL